MSFTLSDVDFRAEMPDIPSSVPVAVHSVPCLKERSGPARLLASILDIEVAGTVDVPHGYALGGAHGQVEVFAASGAIRARNADRLGAYPNERRDWASVERSDDGFQLGGRVAEHLSGYALELLEKAGIRDDYAKLDVVLGQWALLDEKGNELETGPGRATVRLSYESGGVPMIGPGAKTNLHFDPDEEGSAGVLARVFHVRRPVDGAKDVSTQSLEETFEPLLTQTWAGLDVDPKAARLSITAIKFGLLALPADISQGFAAPALAVEGELTGAVAGDGRELPVRFGRYLPLVHPRALAESGLASSGQVVPGRVIGGRSKGK
jgi:hypothetical protein